MLVLVERAAEYLDIFLASVLTLFPAGVILTLAVMLFFCLWSKYLPATRDWDGVLCIFVRILFAVPLSLIVAGTIALTSVGLTLAMGVENPADRFLSLLWWWVPACFGFILLPRVFKGVLISIALLMVTGIIDTHRLHRATDEDKFQLGGRTTEMRRHPWSFDLSSGNKDFAERLMNLIMLQFDPRHFLSVLGDPYVPPAFSYRAEMDLGEDERPEQLEIVGARLRKVGKWCGCPESLTGEEKREVYESLYWKAKEERELIVYEAHHGAFCRELYRGFQSGMLRSWFVLLFFGWGLERALQASVGPTEGKGGIQKVALTTLVVVGVLLGVALAVRFGTPSKMTLTVNEAGLPSEGGDVELEWRAQGAQKYQLEVTPRGLLQEIQIRPTDTKTRVKIPPNKNSAPMFYAFTVSAKGYMNKISRRVSIVVSPEGEIDADLHSLLSSGNDRVRALAVDKTGALYLAGSTEGTLTGKAETPSRDPSKRMFEPENSFAANAKPDGPITWAIEYPGPEGVRVTSIAAYDAQNVFLGGSDRVQEKPSDQTLADIDTTPKEIGSVRLVSNGQESGKRVIGADELEEVTAVATDNAANVYVVGVTGPATRFEPWEEQKVETDAFLAKFDVNGKLEFLVQFGTNRDDGATGVVVGNDGMVYVTGFTEAPAYFRRGGDFGLEEQAFLEQFDPTGKGNWVRKFGALDSLRDEGKPPSLALGENGEIYVSGGSRESAYLGQYGANGNAKWFRASDFQRGSTVAGVNRAVYQAGGPVIAKYNEQGELEWMKQLRNSDYDSRLLVGGPKGLFIAGQAVEEVQRPQNRVMHIFYGKLVPDKSKQAP